MKVVINVCHGGFGLSKEAQDLYAQLKGIELGEYNKSYFFYDNLAVHDIPRDDPALIQVVEQLGGDAANRFSELKIVEIPDDVKWTIAEYDGLEWVAEAHRTWS